MTSPALSDPPENIVIRGAQRTTMADVFMAIAKDGPVYAIVIVVGVLAMRAQASTTELLMTSAIGLLARSWPRPIQVGSSALLAFYIASRFLLACAPAAAVLPPSDIVDVTDYSLALDRCKADGVDAGSYLVYERCAQRADLKFGRKDAGAP